MFRTLYVANGETITVKDNWLVVTTAEQTVKVPLEDLQTVIIDNVHTMFSAYALHKLAENHVNTVICDSSHLPACNIMGLNNHYRPYGMLKKQLALTEGFKALLWQRIVKAKIINQRQALLLQQELPAVTNSWLMRCWLEIPATEKRLPPKCSLNIFTAWIFSGLLMISEMRRLITVMPLSVRQWHAACVPMAITVLWGFIISVKQMLLIWQMILWSLCGRWQIYGCGRIMKIWQKNFPEAIKQALLIFCIRK